MPAALNNGVTRSAAQMGTMVGPLRVAVLAVSNAVAL